MRQREEVQEMLWRKCLILGLLTAAAQAAIWPGKAGEYVRQSTSAPELPNPSVWKEYGLEEAETAEFAGSAQTLRATAYRLQDPTGAVAALQWLEDASTSGTKFLERHGNYVVKIDAPPARARQALRSLAPALPGVINSSAPLLPSYLPEQGLISGSEAYILGPASLSAAEPRISPALVGFHFGAEGQFARYRTPAREVSLLIFSYPTPQIAMAQLRRLASLAESAARRSGPLVSVVLGADDATAGRILNRVQYRAEVTTTEVIPDIGNAGEMILAIMILAGVLILASVVLGVFFGAIRQFFVRAGISAVDNSFTSLNIGNK
jgi:hypothetical protein